MTIVIIGYGLHALLAAATLHLLHGVPLDDLLLIHDPRSGADTGMLDTRFVQRTPVVEDLVQAMRAAGLELPDEWAPVELRYAAKEGLREPTAELDRWFAERLQVGELLRVREALKVEPMRFRYALRILLRKVPEARGFVEYIDEDERVVGFVEALVECKVPFETLITSAPLHHTLEALGWDVPLLEGCEITAVSATVEALDQLPPSLRTAAQWCAECGGHAYCRFLEGDQVYTLTATPVPHGLRIDLDAPSADIPFTEQPRYLSHFTYTLPTRPPDPRLVEDIERRLPAVLVGVQARWMPWWMPSNTVEAVWERGLR